MFLALILLLHVLAVQKWEEHPLPNVGGPRSQYAKLVIVTFQKRALKDHTLKELTSELQEYLITASLHSTAAKASSNEVVFAFNTRTDAQEAVWAIREMDYVAFAEYNSKRFYSDSYNSHRNDL